jgi:hypothetical protein
MEDHMQFSIETNYSFDTDNRAYRRFQQVLGEHFAVVGWTTADTGRPTFMTIGDLDSGDVFTVAILDSLEVRDPYALLTVTVAAGLLAYGPFEGGQAAATAAPMFAEVRATRPVPLHHPEHTSLPDSIWCDLPSELADLRPAPHDAPRVALVLVDGEAGRVAAVGPFTSRAVAAAWRPDAMPGLAERVIVALQSAPTDEPTLPANDEGPGGS